MKNNNCSQCSCTVPGTGMGVSPDCDVTMKIHPNPIEPCTMNAGCSVEQVLCRIAALLAQQNHILCHINHTLENCCGVCGNTCTEPSNTSCCTDCSGEN